VCQSQWRSLPFVWAHEHVSKSSNGSVHLSHFEEELFFLSLSDYFLSEGLNRGSGHLTDRWASQCLILQCFVWCSIGTWGPILAWKIVPAGKSCVFGTENVWRLPNYYSMLWCLILCVKRHCNSTQVFWWLKVKSHCERCLTL